LNDPVTYKRQARDRWNASADAYAGLAEQLTSSPKYADVLWKSAQHYILGYRFRKAHSQLQKFMGTAPKERLPLATVELAYTQLNDDKTKTALELLERTIRLHPKDPASFRAAYLLGVTHLEDNQVESAQQTWRDILENSSLGPAATEWRDSLFALGNSLYHQTSARIASKSGLENKLAKTPENPESAKAPAESTLGNWDESIGKLSEYVRRYPDQGKHYEAQYLLARAYQKSANEYQAKLENAQIANEKQELAKEYHQRLRTARQILGELRARLMREEEQNGLNGFQSRLLQNAFFDLGDIEFSMHEYEAALSAYGGAINRYPEHVRVLLSYLQMAQCYQQLNKPEEGRSMLKQAEILAQRMNDDTFASSSTNIHARKEWTEWFDWTLRMLASPE
jgi:TolA-binding protein